MSSLSRRTLVRGAVWSVPAISIAAAAPAFAVSNQCASVTFAARVNASGGSAKLDLIVNAVGGPYTVTLVSVVNLTTGGTYTRGAGSQNTFTVPPTNTWTSQPQSTAVGNQIRVTYTIAGNTAQCQSTVTVTA